MSRRDAAVVPLATASQSWNWQALSHESRRDKLASSRTQLSDAQRESTPLLRNRAPSSTESKRTPISTATAGVQPSKTQNEAVEAFSGLRITDRTISVQDLHQEMEGRQFIQLMQMDRVPRATFTDKAVDPDVFVLEQIDWVTIGVLTRKTLSKPAVNGSTFMVWALSDLNETELGVFLFGDAYARHWKEVTGSIVAVLNATLLPATEKNKFAFKVTQPTEIVKLGKAVDFGICKGTTSGEARCRLAINTAKTRYCLHHIAASFMRAGQARQQLNNSTGSLRKTLFAGLTKPKNLSAGVYTSASSHSSETGLNPVSHFKKRKRNEATGGVVGIPTVLTTSGAVIQRRMIRPAQRKGASNVLSERPGSMSFMDEPMKSHPSRLVLGSGHAKQPSKRAQKIIQPALLTIIDDCVSRSSALCRKDGAQLPLPKIRKVNMIHFMNTGVQVKK
ncbi:hypothetical protein PsorP6_003204 [Peronosclerospora sorghi]|uniref:Uncharacterized protein n=1 Tax=Peronosclerospora sorghi TaxID=230839 RepID=A0ACC0VPP1_9STRA|nr:hypothetical protein PsorP6_003204 [Peronosclerospora sorghi]